MNILVVNNTYNSPSMGGIRSRLLARGLAQAGHKLTVITSTEADADKENIPGLVQVKVESGLCRRTKKYPESQTTPREKPENGAGNNSVSTGNKWKNLANRWLMVPDKFVVWVFPVGKMVGELLKRESYDVIYATMPVRSNLLAGAVIAKKYGMPLVVEYRDLWTDSPYSHNAMPTAIHRLLHRRLEFFVMKYSERITSVCKGIQQSIQGKAKPFYEKDVGLNYNFFDPACFDRLPPKSRTEVFTIVYVGMLYGSRKPYVFFEGLKLFLDQSNLSPAQIRFDCIGSCAGISEFEAGVKKLGLNAAVNFIGQVPHDQALRYLHGADAALIVQAEGDAIHIPGKLFEAFGARTSILLISEPCEVADIVHQCSAGVVCAHKAESIATGVGALYDKWSKGDSWPLDEKEMDTYRLDQAVVQFEELLMSAVRK